jgi:hypothetical protein
VIVVFPEPLWGAAMMIDFIVINPFYPPISCRAEV